jgi:hypothetical protein
MKSQHLVVGFTVSAVPKPDYPCMQIRKCSDCGERIWIDPMRGMKTALDCGAAFRLVCAPCAARKYASKPHGGDFPRLAAVHSLIFRLQWCMFLLVLRVHKKT